MRTKILTRDGVPPLAEIERDPSGIFVALACCALIGSACWTAIIGLAARLI